MNKLLGFIDLQNGEEEKAKVLDNVVRNTSFRGANLWILACAIVVASVGLNVNSTAVIIGAMLISPLMGPIVGAGFALGTYDFLLLKKSGKNLLIATVVSLIVSTLYFLISPFKDAQSELLARTSPNIYDVLIAFFGGLVGVIAITRAEKGNPIPGVAIATALMPPLCTAGYGLAMGNYAYFLGALYLYTINCFFIGIATFVIVKYLNYPLVNHVNKIKQKQIRNTISMLIILLLVPSIYFAYQMIREKKFKARVDNFIKTEFTDKGQMVVHKKVAVFPTSKIELAFLTKQFSNNEVASLQNKLAQYKLPNTRLVILQDSIIANPSSVNEIGYMLSVQKELEKRSLNQEMVFKEMAILFPEIVPVSMGNHDYYLGTDSSKQVTVLLYQNNSSLDTSNSAKLTAWLQQKLQKQHIELIRK
ncbi:DUF389 domain-containing protein [Sediminibacterium sp.]|uniref:DUF389 domain-containing protein n=1 Tax=Sediminibacterium sp. TaxID=1917865 RepID=UPI002734D087|nr:DUF389 domain-containing protein [Sediminibacterium sp.]MDP3394001.1 DUF389 domain-containing protein [Sediminibacterium sp.]MDP3566776.1 DUF389 domain-containing protein [Sediminibacterium sp.]